jgi:hypothetical protein
MIIFLYNNKRRTKKLRKYGNKEIIFIKIINIHVYLICFTNINNCDSLYKYISVLNIYYQD